MKFLLKGWSFLSSGWGKVLIVSILLGVTFTSGYKTANYVHDSNMLDKLEDLRDEQQARYEKDFELLMDAQEEIVKVKEVIRYVEKETENVETPECTRLGDDWLRLYNNAIEAGNLQRPAEFTDRTGEVQ